MILSVIICSHNPREDYLRRVLNALARQTLPKLHWELLLIDNASEELLEKKYDLSWHPNARHVREEELGLTPARLRGIREAFGEILVFVDDDNVLAEDYLAEALKISGQKSWIGAFGGNVEPEFECKPKTSLGNLVDWVGVIRVLKEEWAMGLGCSAMFCTPIGAGMVIRKAIAEFYASQTLCDPLREVLDRKGESLFCHGDTDMALCSCDLGMAVGRFPQLHLKHLIPKKRIAPDYIFHLIEAAACSDAIFRYVRDGKIQPEPIKFQPSRSEMVFNFYKRIRKLLKPSEEVKSMQQIFDEVWMRGSAKGRKILESHLQTNHTNPPKHSTEDTESTELEQGDA